MKIADGYLMWNKQGRITKFGEEYDEAELCQFQLELNYLWVYGQLQWDKCKDSNCEDSIYTKTSKLSTFLAMYIVSYIP